MITGPALTIAVFVPVAGGLADRLRRKGLLVLATLAYALLGVLPALLSDLTGAGGGQRAWPRRRLAGSQCDDAGHERTAATDAWRGMGGFTSSLYLGQFASPLLIAALLPAGDGLHDAIRLAAAAAVVVAVLWAVASLRRRASVLSTDSQAR